MRYEPLHDRIIARAVEENKQTAGGLWVPDVATANKHVGYAEVIAVGTGRVNLEGTTIPLHVKVGDLIAFPRKAPALLPIVNPDNTEEIVLLLREAEVVAIVHDLPRATGLVGVNGRTLAMIPTSRGLPDSVYENRDALAVARAEGWDHAEDVDDAPPGEAPPE